MEETTTPVPLPPGVNLAGCCGIVTGTVTITRKETGKVEQYTLVGRVNGYGGDEPEKPEGEQK